MDRYLSLKDQFVLFATAKNLTFWQLYITNWTASCSICWWCCLVCPILQLWRSNYLYKRLSIKFFNVVSITTDCQLLCSTAMYWYGRLISRISARFQTISRLLEFPLIRWVRSWVNCHGLFFLCQTILTLCYHIIFPCVLSFDTKNHYLERSSKKK